MLRVELLGTAIALTILWLVTFGYAVTQAGAPPTGIILTVITVATGATWWLICVRHLRSQLQDMRSEVQRLREERDVEEAVQRLRPNLHIVSHDN